MSAWAERPALLRQGWLEPPEGLTQDGNALIGCTVFVMGHGKGRTLEFSKSRVGSSSHMIEFEEGGTQKVHLERKGNNKTPFLVMGEVDAMVEGGFREEQEAANAVGEAEEVVMKMCRD